MTSTGVVAPPVTATRSEDRSMPGPRAAAIMSWNIVGAPGTTVMPWAVMRRATSATSNTAWGTLVAPRTAQARMPAFSPEVWK
jgi:hypothetical protein